jgi:hypothetical protein
MQNNSSQAVIVLGMHRSGTSALAGALSMLGINPGEHLMPAHADTNPKGFWEHNEIVKVHNLLFEKLGSNWADISALPNRWWKRPEVLSLKSKLRDIVQHEFAESSLWLLKDPRLCRFLPMWLDILNELGVQPYFVICLRNPSEVVASLNKRDGMIKEEAYLLWLKYVLESERWSREYPRTVVTYTNILKNWRSVSSSLEKALDINLKGEDPTVVQNIDEFLEPGLRHHVASVYTLSKGEIPALALKVYELMISTHIGDLEESLSDIYRQVDEKCDLVSPWITRNRALEKENMDLKQQNSWQQSELSRVKSTVSWQVTKPLRFCAFLYRRLFGNR